MSFVHLYILLDLFIYLYVLYSPKSKSNPKLCLGPHQPTSEIHYVTTYHICKFPQNPSPEISSTDSKTLSTKGPKIRHGKGSRIISSCWKSERSNPKGGKAGQEEAASRTCSQAYSVQSPFCHCRCWFWKEEGT
ncbi:hypothetical protein HanPI659440_Chr12g0444821 [Helianthus annuus]|nr:hypothetical protein HanPI659440_Chr12g0444821 [Helianthus annuus]